MVRYHKKNKLKLSHCLDLTITTNINWTFPLISKCFSDWQLSEIESSFFTSFFHNSIQNLKQRLLQLDDWVESRTGTKKFWRLTFVWRFYLRVRFKIWRQIQNESTKVSVIKINLFWEGHLYLKPLFSVLKVSKSGNVIWFLKPGFFMVLGAEL